MNRLLFVIMALYVSSMSLSAQDVQTIRILKDKMTSLTQGWKYIAEDNYTFKEIEADESQWKTFNPTADIHDSLPADLNNKVGWMRLHFTVDSGMHEQPLSILIRQSIASEIYLNGSLIRKFGQIEPGKGGIRAFDPRWKPLQLNFLKSGPNLLAVRIAEEPRIRYVTHWGVTNPICNISIAREGVAINTYGNIFKKAWMDFFQKGILFFVFLTHLIFYILSPAQKNNLYFSIGTLFSVIAMFLHSYYYLNSGVNEMFIIAFWGSVGYMIGQILVTASIVQYLQIRRKYILLPLAIISSLMILVGMIWYKDGFEISANMPIVTYLFIIVLAIISRKQFKRESEILIIGFSLAILCFVGFLSRAIAQSTDHLLSTPFNFPSFLYLAFNLLPPISVSILLARDFARTTKLLAHKLNEVEQLSAKNLTSEREKQTILESQNQILEDKVADRTKALENSLTELKSTQAQLIHSEKMASLGELTAGIAHEIQNPLNFVNNFSEINVELSAEILSAATNGDLEEVKAIAADIKNNQQKINEHGKRADSIVKSMLQHSRVSAGEKGPGDLNALADKYLRLAYHGMRVKDKRFNADFELKCDPHLPHIHVVAQDIGRVLLNLFNNAFYAVHEKSKTAGDGYQPAITVTTEVKYGESGKQHLDLTQPSSIILSVKDNGNGIPPSIKDKIFQPFFTTKPTGQGTGLGLSLSYDIVKAHGGEIHVSSASEEGTTIQIQLPIQNFNPDITLTSTKM